MKYMTQMSAAAFTNNFRSSAIRIRHFFYSIGHLIVKARPAALGFKFIFRPVKQSAALSANVKPGFIIVPVFSGKWRLSALIYNYALLCRSQFIKFNPSAIFPRGSALLFVGIHNNSSPQQK
jgi:hypothetical protein